MFEIFGQTFFPDFIEMLLKSHVLEQWFLTGDSRYDPQLGHERLLLCR